ncbi:MAG TPA: hypothetical protein VN937_17190 [Blastocatellia bacterium]|nr:hypothetical protein [Blastocatellia bacterium]
MKQLRLLIICCAVSAFIVVAHAQSSPPLAGQSASSNVNSSNANSSNANRSLSPESNEDANRNSNTASTSQSNNANDNRKGNAEAQPPQQSTSIVVGPTGIQLSGFPTWIIWVVIGTLGIGSLSYYLWIKPNFYRNSNTRAITEVCLILLAAVLLVAIGIWLGNWFSNKGLEKLVENGSVRLARDSTQTSRDSATLPVDAPIQTPQVTTKPVDSILKETGETSVWGPWTVGVTIGLSFLLLSGLEFLLYRRLALLGYRVDQTSEEMHARQMREEMRESREIRDRERWESQVEERLYEIRERILHDRKRWESQVEERLNKMHERINSRSLGLLSDDALLSAKESIPPTKDKIIAVAERISNTAPEQSKVRAVALQIREAVQVQDYSLYSLPIQLYRLSDRLLDALYKEVKGKERPSQELKDLALELASLLRQ